MGHLKKIISLALCIAIFFLALFGAQNLLMPKYMAESREGRLTREYYQDSHQNDLLIIGDCEVYENISPITLWEEYGIPSFIRGNAKQLMWQSCAMLEDALRYETPKVVLLSALAMMYGEPQRDSEAYNRLALDGMRWSRTKYEAIRASMLPDENVASYFLPILRFHDRWSELDKTDLQYFFAKRQVGIAGFVMRSDVLPFDWIPGPKPLPSYDFGDMAWEYLDNFTALCKEKNIQLVLFKAPSLTPHWYAEWDEQIALYARAHDLVYLNALDKLDEIGLDFAVDTYDAGLHLNRQGAEKMARYLGEYLREHCPALTDRRGEEALEQDWAMKSSQYYAMQAAQEREIAESGEGKVETFFVPVYDPNQPIPERTEPPPAIDISFTPGGIQLELGANPTQALEALAEPLAIYESPAYNHQPLDNRTYRYEGFHFTAANPEQGDSIILDIKLTDDRYALPSGITIGSSTLEDVIAAYGTGHWENDGFYTYTQGPYNLRFTMQDGKVIQILMLYDIFD